MALDASPYEGAEIIHDMCLPIPNKLRGCADFIFNGSCLDNIFDPAQALRNISAMLRPEGRVMMFEHGTMIQGAFTVFSPEWFFDFFAANRYADCQVQIGCFDDIFGPWRIQNWEPFDESGQGMFDSMQQGDFVTICTAEKGPGSTDNIMPIQAQYRAQHSKAADPYLPAWRKYKQSGRRHG